MKRIYNGFTAALERSCRLPSGSLPTGEGGGRGRVSFPISKCKVTTLFLLYKNFACFFCVKQFEIFVIGQ